MGLLSGDGPKLNIVPVDPTTLQMAGDMYKRSTASDSATADVANHGIQERGMNAMGSDQQASQSAAASGQDPNMMKAIRNQYQAEAGQGIQDIVNKNKMNAPIHRAALLDQSSMAQEAAGQVQTNNYQALTQANLDYEQARAQTLNSILTSVGAVGGMYLGSRQKGSGEAETSQRRTNDFYDSQRRAPESVGNFGGHGGAAPF